MRYLSSKPIFFIVAILSAALYFRQGNSSVNAASAPPSLKGEAAVAHLIKQGLYSSLVEAAGAARHDEGSLSSRSEQDDASSPESTLAINLPLTQLFRQTALDGAANDDYGWSIAANNETVVVGARLDDIDANDHQGSVYVFSRSASDWTLQQKLTAGDGEAEERFGESVAISGNTIVVGAHFADPAGLGSGAAYLFRRVEGQWRQQAKLAPNDGAAGEELGNAVAVDDGTIAAGALRGGPAGTAAGSVSVFEQTERQP